MPVTYTEWDEETSTWVEVPYYSVAEVADMWRMSESTVRRRMKTGGWEVFTPLGTDRMGVHLMNPKQIAAALDTMKGPIGNGHDPDIAEGGPARLGVPVDPADLEGFREPTPDPEDPEAEADE